jgi:hypothetical protein
MKNADPKERRGFVRLPRREEVSIQVLLPCEDGRCPSRVVASETLDVSCHGLRLRLPESVPTQHVFDLCIELGDDPRRYLLTGETRWCRPAADERGFEAGITVLDGEGTDYAAWARHFDDAG